MATPTAISNDRPRVRTPVTVGSGPATGTTLALDWANGQLVASSGTSAASAVFDANNDRIVEVATSAAIYYIVGPSTPTASKAAGNQYLAAGGSRLVYVPLNNKIAVIQDSAGGNVMMVPALIST